MLFLFLRLLCIHTYILQKLFILFADAKLFKQSPGRPQRRFSPSTFPVRWSQSLILPQSKPTCPPLPYSIDSDRSSQPKSDTLRCRSTCSNAAMVSTNLARCRFRLNMQTLHTCCWRERDFLFESSGYSANCRSLVFFARQLYNTFGI